MNKESVKKFYNNHKRELVTAAMYLGTGVAVVATTINAYNQGVRSVDVSNHQSRVIDGETFAKVVLSNGCESYWKLKPADK